MNPIRVQHLRRGFTLIELLVVIGIIAILATLVLMLAPQMINRSQKAASLNNMRQIGAAIAMYAGEHDYELPRRATGSDDKWPKLLSTYLDGSAKVYLEPGSKENFITRKADPLSNSRNETSYIMNGYNDVGALNDPSVTVRLNAIDKPGQVILLGTPKAGSGHFYMDMLEGGGNHRDVLNLKAYGDGSNYLFGDGSAKFLKEDEYRHEMWLVNREFSVP